MSKQPKKPKKTRRDVAEIARDIVEQVTGERLSGGPKPDQNVDSDQAKKDSWAIESGSRGGKIGGPARAANLSPEERKEIARKAARSRWEKHREGGQK